jgi:hypothetical protein
VLRALLGPRYYVAWATIGLGIAGSLALLSFAVLQWSQRPAPPAARVATPTTADRGVTVTAQPVPQLIAAPPRRDSNVSHVEQEGRVELDACSRSAP